MDKTTKQEEFRAALAAIWLGCKVLQEEGEEYISIKAVMNVIKEVFNW